MTVAPARRRGASFADFALFLPALLLALGPAPLAWADTFYVDDDASPGGDGSLATPWQTITEAMQSGVLMPGDEVIVAPGLYDQALGESFPVSFVSGVSLTGPGSATPATVRTSNGPVLRITGAPSGTTTVVSGMHFEIGNSAALGPGTEGGSGVVHFDGDGDDPGEVRVEANELVTTGYGVTTSGVPGDLTIANNVSMLPPAAGFTQGLCRVEAGVGFLEGPSTPESIRILGNEVHDGDIRVFGGPGTDLDLLTINANDLFGGDIFVGVADGVRIGAYTVATNTLQPTTNPTAGGPSAGDIELVHGGALSPPEGAAPSEITGPIVMGNMIGESAGIFVVGGPNTTMTSTTISQNTLLGEPPQPIEGDGNARIFIGGFGAVIDSLTVIDNDLFDAAEISASFAGDAEVRTAQFVNNELRSASCVGGNPGDFRISFYGQTDFAEGGPITTVVVDGLLVSGNELTPGEGGAEGCASGVTGAGILDVNFFGNADAQNIVVTDNTVVGAENDGISVDHFARDGSFQTADVTVDGNTVTGAGGNCIELSVHATSSDGVVNVTHLVQNNTTSGASMAGIRLDYFAGSSDLLVPEGPPAGNFVDVTCMAVNNAAVTSFDGLNLIAGVFGSNELVVDVGLDGNSLAGNQENGLAVRTPFTDDFDALLDADVVGRYNSVHDNGRAGVFLGATHFSDEGVGEVALTLRGNTITGNGGNIQEGVAAAGGVVLAYGYSTAATNDLYEVSLESFNTIGPNGAPKLGNSGSTTHTSSAVPDIVFAAENAIDHITVPATQNWWGTTSTLAIENRIHHNPDDAQLGTVDFACPLPDTLDFTAEPFHVTANGGQTVTVTAGPKTGFVPYAGFFPLEPLEGPAKTIQVTLGTLIAETVQVSEDNLSLTFESPAGLAYGPAKLEIVNPEGQTGSIMLNINELPVAVMDSFATSQKTHVVMDVAANDEDGNGSVVDDSVEIVSPPANGAAVVQTDGTIFYLPSSGFFGTDTLMYTIEDDEGAKSLPGVVTIEVAEGCGTTIYCFGKDTSQGTEPRIGGDGQPSVALNDFKITLHDAAPASYGIVIASATGPDSQPFLGGTLCIAQPFVRSYETFVHHSGIARIDVPLGPEMIDQKLWFQWWLRDPLQTDGTGVAFSDAMLVLFCE